MKLATKILSLLVLVVITIFYSSCGGDDKKKKTDAEKQLDALKTTWTLQSASDGTDRTTDFPNLKLTVSGTFAQDGTYNYSFTGTRPNPSPWPGSGTWKFGTNPMTEIIRDPGSPQELPAPSNYSLSDGGNTLTINFNIPAGHTGFAGGTSRIRSVSGDWTFVFVRQ